LPEIPTAEELLTEKDPEILIKPVNPQPASKAEYLETQYRLCRVEATELIRRAIRRFRSDEAVVDTNDFHIYTQVCRPQLTHFRCGYVSNLTNDN
jgi:hypothetical protein